MHNYLGNWLVLDTSNLATFFRNSNQLVHSFTWARYLNDFGGTWLNAVSMPMLACKENEV